MSRKEPVCVVNTTASVLRSWSCSSSSASLPCSWQFSCRHLLVHVRLRRQFSAEATFARLTWHCKCTSATTEDGIRLRVGLLGSTSKCPLAGQSLRPGQDHSRTQLRRSSTRSISWRGDSLRTSKEVSTFSVVLHMRNRGMAPRRWSRTT